jgi:superfamily I DNA/RNA helicase
MRPAYLSQFWLDPVVAAFMGRSLSHALKSVQIPVEWLNEDSNSKRYKPESQSVKLLTMHSSKGLEFPVVFIAGVGYMPMHPQENKDEARLLYVAMTRRLSI